MFVSYKINKNKKLSFKRKGPYILYYSRTFKRWRYVKIWSYLEKPRFFRVYDTIRKEKYNHWYVGEGLENVHWTKENLEYLKNKKDIDNEQINLINNTNEYYKQIFEKEEQRKREGKKIILENDIFNNYGK